MMEDYFTQPVLDAVQQLVPVAKDAGVTVAQLSLAWCLRRPAISSVIIGATKTSQVDDNVVAANVDIDRAVFARMDEILQPVLPKPPAEQFV
jgi:aryl-alcohol dehydrogenase-like predicted oxidoreductase